MGYSDDALDLRTSSPSELPRLTDRCLFLYVDRSRIAQDRTGVVAYSEDGRWELPVPSAALAVVVCGPGTSITTPTVIMTGGRS